MNIGSLSGSIIQNMNASLANEYPDGITSSQFAALSPKIQELMQKAMQENGFPEGLMQRLNDIDASDNSDVWDAQVTYMAEHPDEAPENFDQIDATIREMAQNPDAEAAYLDTLVSDMATEPGASIKDVLGGGILQNMGGTMLQMLGQIGDKLETQEVLSSDELTQTVQESTTEQDLLEVQQQNLQQQEMFQQMNNILDNLHETSLNVVENLQGDSGTVIEGETELALSEENVIDADPETEVFDAYTDENGDGNDDSYSDDPGADALA